MKKKNAGSFATDGWMYGCHGFFLARITTEKKKNFFQLHFFFLGFQIGIKGEQIFVFSES